MTDPIAFTLAVLVVLATPGPTNTLLAISGATVGFRRSLLLMPAEALAYLTSILTIGFLVGPIVWKGGWPADLLRVVVAVYLAFLATRLWKFQGFGSVEARPVGVRHVFVTTLLNPKAAIFALVVIPLQDPAAATYVVAFLVMLVAISACWITIGEALSRGFLSEVKPSFVLRVGATVLGFFAAFLVWTALTNELA